MPDLKAASKLSDDYREVVKLWKEKGLEGRAMLHAVAAAGRTDLIQAAMDMDLKTGRC